MRFQETLLWLLAIVTLSHAFALPTALDSFSEASQALFKRKGGGGGGKGGGSGSSSSSGSSSGSSSSGGSSSGSSGGGGSTRGSGTSSGTSSIPKNYGGSYAGGASTGYRSGTSSRGVTPYLIGGAGLAFFPGIWLYGAYAYNYGHPYSYRNNTSNQNMTVNATCLCDPYSDCGCDDNNSTDYQNQVANNATLSKLATVNGTQQLFINGTLPNVTSDEDTTSGAASMARPFVELSGFWTVVAGVVYTVWIM